ncbi:MAG: phosphoribosylglycinamide formyltransferase [Thaumarchaeota archaeon]|nr:phosphoribosylglycinamide formyltransferase [Nitrososphaerota archaeon]
MTCNIGVLVSGRGSNLEAILKAVKRREITRARVAVVISNKPGVRALEVAKRFGVPTEVIESEGLDRTSYDARLVDSLRRHGVEPESGLILLAGYMRLLTLDFVSKFQGRILNIHPSLLPSFPGLNAQEQALAYGVKAAGCTVHFVVPEVDAGPIVLQNAVRVKEDDTVESLSERILRREHVLFPLAVKLFVEGKLSIKGRKVAIRP